MVNKFLLINIGKKEISFCFKVVLGEEGEGDSFMEQWVRECLVERGKPKSPEKMLQYCDPAWVDTLLAQFNSPDSELKNR